VIRGALEVSRTVPVAWEPFQSDGCPINHTGEKAFGLWFLQKGPSGWIANPFSRPSFDLRSVPVRLSEPDPAPKDSIGTPIDQIVTELLVATRADDADVAENAYLAIETITSLRPRILEPPYHPKGLGPDHEAACPLRFLLAKSDSVIVERIEKELVSGRSPRGVDALWDVRDPRTLPALARILDSGLGGRDVRRATREAVRNIHTEAAIPLLLGFLDEPDLETRQEGAMGLYMLAAHCPPGELKGCPRPNGDPAVVEANSHYPSISRFQNDLDGLVSYWKEWASNRSAAVQEKATR
jgi:hypothetical protein